MVYWAMAKQLAAAGAALAKKEKTMPQERYIGDGVYAQLDPGRMIVLRTARGEEFYGGVHWIALEPEVFVELMRFAFDIGWGHLILNFAHKKLEEMEDEDYARDQEDKQRKRDAAEGFDE